MSSVQLKDLKGKAVGEIKFAEELSAIEPNVHVMHSALHRQLANGRAGTASTKTRSEVRGGGRKPWRQKGTGRARAGSIRSPLWNGGGVIFGPKPRDFFQSMPKKARQLALRSAVAARKDQFVVVKSFDGLFKKAPTADSQNNEQPKTKEFAGVLKNLGINDKALVLVLLDSQVAGEKQIEKAARNIHNVRVLNLNNLNVKDMLEAEVVLTSEHTVELMNQRFGPHKDDKKAKLAVKRQPSKRSEEKTPLTEEERLARKKAKAAAKKAAKAAKPPKVKAEKAQAKGGKGDKPKGEKPEGGKPESKGDAPEAKGEKPEHKGGKPEHKGDKPEHKGDKPEHKGDKPEAKGGDKKQKTEE
jgi:large subunit ribosomal protein L4